MTDQTPADALLPGAPNAATGLVTELLVRTDRLSTSRLRQHAAPDLVEGEIRVRIDRFALTANNITYAAFGDAMNYWRFFPAHEAGWGIVPVWGFATVTDSRCDDTMVGERLYGYWPMADQAVLTPVRADADGFLDGAAHRRELHPVYNRYLRCATDPLYSADTEDLQALLRPLFTTSWLIDDFLDDEAFFGAGTLLLSSASSKTAWGTAFMLAQRHTASGNDIEVVGLTSPANKVFCESLGCYDRVVGYDELDQLPSDAPCVYIDFAGNAALRRAVHTRFVHLRHSSAIGGTHVTQLGGAGDLPGPRPTLFFAPARIKKRGEEWGAEVLNERLLTAWQAFIAQVGDPEDPWLVADHHHGPAAVQAAYAEVLGGRSHPRVGHVLSFDPAD